MAWIDEIKKALKANPGKSVADVIPIAKKSYAESKSKLASGVDTVAKAMPMPVKKRAKKGSKKSAKKGTKKRAKKGTKKRSKKGAKKGTKKGTRKVKRKGKKGGNCGACAATAQAPAY